MLATRHALLGSIDAAMVACARYDELSKAASV